MDAYGISVLAIAVLAFGVIRWRSTKYPKNVLPKDVSHHTCVRIEQTNPDMMKVSDISDTEVGEIGVNPFTGELGTYMGNGMWVD